MIAQPVKRSAVPPHLGPMLALLAIPMGYGQFVAICPRKDILRTVAVDSHIEGGSGSIVSTASSPGEAQCSRRRSSTTHEPSITSQTLRIDNTSTVSRRLDAMFVYPLFCILLRDVEAASLAMLTRV